MSEERLIEITTNICSLGGHLWPMVYLSRLSKSESYLFFKYVGSSKYHGMPLCYAVVAFSYDYLKSKNISLMEITGTDDKNIIPTESEDALSSYLNAAMMSSEELNATSLTRR